MKKLAAFLLMASAALAQAPKKFDKAALEAYLRHMEMWIPQVTVQIDDPKPAPYLKGFDEVVVHLSYNGNGKDERYYVSFDGTSLVKGDTYDLTKNPFQANLDKIKTDNQPSYNGDAKAPVTMAIFGDFQCPYCKAEAEIVRKNVATAFPGKVRVVFKDFPLESIHPWARAASDAGRCVYKQSGDAFWNFHDWIYTEQQEIQPNTLSDKILDWAGKNKVDAAALKTCMDAKTTDADVAANIAEGKALGINATPTSYINGRKLEGTLQWEVLEQLLKMELASATGAK
jgi:protein-disulfide isomerase